MKPDWLGVNECTYLGGAHGASAEVNERLLNWRVEGGLQGTLLVVEVWQMLNLASHRHHLQRYCIVHHHLLQNRHIQLQNDMQ